MKFIFKLFLLLIYTISFSEDTVVAKDIYLSYTSYPKRVFTHQKFDLHLKAVILKSTNDYDKIAINFVDQKNIKIIDKNPKWIKDKDNTYTTKITFKINDERFTLPLVTIALIKDDNIVDYLSINPPKIIFEKIAINQDLFSNVIAKDLQINSIKTKQYTNSELLTTINIEALNGNLEDFYLSSYKEQGIKDLEDNYPNQSIYYYVIIPSHKKEIKFTYYNTLLKDFKTITVQINLEEELVSTQTNLNPYSSSILFYKQLFIFILLAITLLLFIYSKKNRYLFLMAILISIIAYLYIPNKKIVLDKGDNIYILPTKNSTIFYTLKQKELVEIINQNNDFTKVLFNNKKIGWIKNDNR